MAGRAMAGRAMAGRAGPGFSWALVVALLRRPHLWRSAATLALRLAEPGWWRHWPPRPSPPPEYLAFRLQTMYGDRDGPQPGATRLRPDELLAYVEWCYRLSVLAR